MVISIVRKMLGLVTLLFFSTILVFFISKYNRADPINTLLGEHMQNSQLQAMQIDKKYEDEYRRRNLHLPYFYFTLVPSHYPKHNNAWSAAEKQSIERLLDAGYKGSSILLYIETLGRVRKTLSPSSDSMDLVLDKTISFLYQDDDLNKNLSRLETVKHNQTPDIKESIVKMLDESPSSFLIFPSVRWHGFNNQYHRWLKNTMTGNFGLSIVDNQPTLDKILPAMKWTLLMTIISLVICFPLGIVIGFIQAHYRGRWIDHVINVCLFSLYAIPLFWLATLFIVFFTTPEYGSWTDIFVSPIFRVRSDYSVLQNFFLDIPQIILPVLCLSLHGLAIIGKLVKESVLSEMSKPYVLQLKSKGLPSLKIYLNHILKNIGTSMVTMISNTIPRMFAGSLLIEVIFNIPGMGRLMFNSILAADWEVVYIILLMSVVITTVVFFLADLTYRLLDPRMKNT